MWVADRYSAWSQLVQWEGARRNHQRLYEDNKMNDFYRSIMYRPYADYKQEID